MIEIERVRDYLDAAIAGDDILGGYGHHVSIGENVLGHGVHFEVVDVRPVAHVFVIESIGVKARHFNGEVIG